MNHHSIIFNNTFSTNFASDSAGAIDLRDPGSVLIADNEFFYNRADRDAGAIFYACHPDVFCDVALIGNTFLSNRAGSSGGALRWVNKNFTLTSDDTGGTLLERRLSQAFIAADTNSYIGNEAPYGPVSASYPRTINVTQIDSVGGRARVLELAPGQVSAVNMTIYDQEGRISLEENNIIV